MLLFVSVFFFLDRIDNCTSYISCIIAETRNNHFFNDSDETKVQTIFFCNFFFHFFFLNSHLLIHQHTVNFLLYSPKFRRKCRLLSARSPDSRIHTVVASLRNVWNRRMADRLIRLDAGYREFQHNFRTNRIISSFEGWRREGEVGWSVPCTATLANSMNLTMIKWI